MKAPKRSVLAAVLACAALCGTACGRAPGRPSGLRLYAFVDRSASIRPGQQSQWERDSQRLTRAIGPGWGVTVFAVHDQTLSAGPLFTAEIPPRSGDEGVDELRRLKAAVRAARAGASQAFTKAFREPGKSSATDLFGAVDRILPDSEGRPTVAVFFSDMIHSTDEFDMERGPLPGDGDAALFKTLAVRHFWRPETLRGVRVYCLLNSRGSGERGPHRLVLKRFYQRLFAALGADLALFDTHVNSWNVMHTKGAGNAGN